MRCITLTKLAQELGERVGKPYSLENLTGKLKRGTITLKEAYIIADILDYDLEFIDKLNPPK